MVLSIIFLEDKHKILQHLSMFYEYQQFFQHHICFSIQPPDYSDPWPRLAHLSSFFLIRLLNQLRIGTKSAFEFHNNRSVQISVILSNSKIKKIIWNYFMRTYISNFQSIYIKFVFMFYKYLISILFSKLKKEQKSLFFSHYFDSNDRLYL